MTIKITIYSVNRVQPLILNYDNEEYANRVISELTSNASSLDEDARFVSIVEEEGKRHLIWSPVVEMVSIENIKDVV